MSKEKESKDDKILISLLVAEFHIKREYAKWVADKYNKKKRRREIRDERLHNNHTNKRQDEIPEKSPQLLQQLWQRI
jgi:hypothetical protein